MQDPAFWTQLALSIIGPGGAAAVAVKVVLNGTKERVKEIASDVKDTREGVQHLREIYHNHEARIHVLEKSEN